MTYDELPYQHWWWDSLETNDGGVMHDAVMRAWTARAAAGTPEVPQKSTRKFGLPPT